ncbi:hypothetical protein K493DRAFT_388856 [Basidiobolus meristosporus CBS 931.73]|uniref:DUF2421 domain-containing protein n=1 Tax=Basidiobolus meristosporus CBS 931.73 TaxID=1314790 RepID=A0A1Y1YVF5_9FUNG|nr:hypothetical protein K493DRAFT_388856 [Basidiobolus meristosporus CBS 931.73]|eukprot:ORY01555.1 hypothetical protein K493DRAFT_388856 [Basidiobolus meristosporus CBS 931.73]
MPSNSSLSITIPPETLVLPSPEISPTETIFQQPSSDPTTSTDVKQIKTPSIQKSTQFEIIQTSTKRCPLRRMFAPFHNLSSKLSIAHQYAFQVACGVLFASLSTFVPTFFIYGSNWVGITIVVVLQENFGASLKQGVLRGLGTTASGLISIVLIVIAQHFPASVSHWLAPAFLAISLFIFTYLFSYMKKKYPNVAYAGTIGCITMQIVMLDGYYDLLDNDENLIGVGFRRIACVLAGVIIGMLFSLFVFPQKASYALRKELGNIMGSIADMYSSISGIPPEVYSRTDITAQSDLLSGFGRKLSRSRTLSIYPVHAGSPEDNAPIMSLDEARSCALNIIARLTKQMAKIDFVSNEYLIQVPFHLFRNRHLRDLERARRYKCAIQFMQEMVYPFISLTYLGAVTELTAAYVNDNNTVGSATINGNQDRTLAAFSSKTMCNFSRLMLIVMHRSSEILLDGKCNMHRCYDQWDEMKNLLDCAHQEVSSELDRVVEQLTGKTDNVLELVAYYGFLTRSEACWKSLTKAVSSFSTFPDNDD